MTKREKELLDKYCNFTDDELYILERSFIESSWEFTMGDKGYTEAEADLQNELLNEVIDVMKLRENEKHEHI